MKRSFILLAFIFVTFVQLSCSSQEPVANAEPPEKVCDPISDTPTEAYKRLFAAVKQKNTDKIKGEMSQMSQELAESLAGRQKVTLDKVYENGLTGTTFSDSLPIMRDERIGSCYAGLEVRNSKEQRWEDLPFAIENGQWKLAVGELFGGQYQSPGKPQDQRDREAANIARGPGPPPVNMMANMNQANTNSAPQAPPPAPK
ncbi:MAG TPA: hypothetical protein PKD26_00470 [Pyrinomonadaceae bacterium]|nr:hypothetical protein [Pyrinomonadaceae bacterium]